MKPTLEINIVGRGVFGTFLYNLLNQLDYVQITVSADIVILAVPSSAYEEVAEANADKLLVNVCSIQEKTNMICAEHSAFVLGIHPLFGARTPANMEKVCLVTRPTGCISAERFMGALHDLGVTVLTETPNGNPITGAWHDQLMSGTHLQALKIAEHAAPMLLNGYIASIPDAYLPASVVKLRELVSQLRDMPEGTRTSIRDNPYE